MARPGKYETHVAPRFEEIKDWVRNGATDKYLWEKLGISERSFYQYKNEFSQFSQVLKETKDYVDAQVESSLLKRALGYSYNEVTKEFSDGEVKVTKIVTKQVVPDTTAQIFWLKNRRPEQWRDKPPEKATDEPNENEGVSINIKDCSKDDED